ncbi:hypothetical protein D3C72_2410440 [compost metagenome]
MEFIPWSMAHLVFYEKRQHQTIYARNGVYRINGDDHIGNRLHLFVVEVYGCDRPMGLYY